MNPAARVLGETLERESTAPRECRASWAGESVAFVNLRACAVVGDVGGVLTGEVGELG